MSAPRPHIRFCKARDGACIAMAVSGKGPPLVRATHWLSHAEYDSRSPVWEHWIRELSRSHSYIRYDQRGCGLSDAAPPTVSFDAWVEDLEAVTEHLGLKRFALFGMSQGGATAITYAVRHPERVSRLILCGAYGRGRMRRPLSPEAREEAEMMPRMIRLGWGRDNPAFRQFFTSRFMPEGSAEQHKWFNELERISATPENAARIVETTHTIDVSHLCEKVRVPTLVLHARDDACVPFEEGRMLAALIPGARFVPLDSRNHVLVEDEPAWLRFLAEVRSFLAEDDGAMAAFEEAGLTPSERAVLALLATGLDNAGIAAALGKREKTVRNQVSSIFAKLGVRSRAEAIVQAREAGVSEAA